MIIRNPTAPLLLLLLSLSSLLPFVLAGTPTSFCKCTCFSNSTIIPLGPPKPHTSSNPNPKPEPDKRSLFRTSLLTNEDGEDAPIVPRHARPASRADDDSNKSASDDNKDAKKFRAATCNDCNRKFCLEFQLPVCKGAKEEDVMTTCFQRESNKDKAVVLIFIIATASLLVWAAVKPWAERWIQAARERRLYIPISSREDTN